MNSEAELQAFIARHVAVVEPLVREAELAAWDLQTTSRAEAKARSQDLSARVAKIYADPQDYAFLRDLPTDSLRDARLARQHELLRTAYLGSQMTDAVIEEMIALGIEIEDVFNTYRARVGENTVSANEIEDILITSQDVAQRREAWAASKSIGAQVAEKVLQLVRLRNREAQRLGFANYYAMGLALEELDETRLFALLDELGRASEAQWHTYKTGLDAELAARFQTTPDLIRPWHHANPFFQEPGPGEADLDRFFADKNLEALTAQFFQTIGLPVDDLLQKADLYEREGKCQHAFCMDVDRQGDVRVLCNNRPSERWMSTMLHEFGHAVYDKFNDRSLPFLLRAPAHTLTTEAIALFMGRLTKDAGWLHRYAGVAQDEADRIAGLARRELRDHLLVFMRWCLVMTHFERALYQNPEQNLTTLWWELVARYQNVICPVADRPPHSWAAKIHLATAPVYYHNYQLGEMVASQLLHHLKTTVLADDAPNALIASPKVGQYLRERIFAPGATRAWEAWLEHATGEPLNPAYFARQLEEG